MKKLIVLGIVAVMGLATMASAAPVIDDGWVVQMRAELSGKSLANATFGTKLGAGDGYVTPEDAAYTSGMAPYAYVASVVGGVEAKIDYRAPLTEINTDSAPKVWNLVINASGPGTVTLKAWMLSSAAADIADGCDNKVALVQNGVKLFEWDASTPSGTSVAPNFTGDFEFTGTPIELQLVSVVPEPGSMLAMLSGLVGLVGYGIRRRK